MTIARNIKIVFFLLMFPFCCAIAQEEYTWELGGAIGGSFYMGDAKAFPHLYVWSGIWQDMGWSSIMPMVVVSSAEQQMI